MTTMKENVSAPQKKIDLYKHYGIVSSKVIRNPNLSLGAKNLYTHLATYVSAEQSKQGKHRPGQAENGSFGSQHLRQASANTSTNSKQAWSK